jgi:hypothetical protein
MTRAGPAVWGVRTGGRASSSWSSGGLGVAAMQKSDHTSGVGCSRVGGSVCPALSGGSSRLLAEMVAVGRAAAAGVAAVTAVTAVAAVAAVAAVVAVAEVADKAGRLSSSSPLSIASDRNRRLRASPLSPALRLKCDLSREVAVACAVCVGVGVCAVCFLACGVCGGVGVCVRAVC